VSTTAAPSRATIVTSAGGSQEKNRKPFSWGRALAWTAMIILILITLFPLYWMLRTAFSTSKSLFTDPASLLPVDFTLGAFERVLGTATPEEARAEGGSGAAVSFWLFLRNSFIFATVCTVGQVFFSALAAYAFARLRWPGRDKVFFLFLTSLMVPPIFTLLPNFILIRNLGWINTFAGLVAPYLLMTPFAIFFLRQFFLGINREVEEAAKLDGAGHWRIFFRIILPMSVSPITTLAILTFINMWNEYFWPLLVGNSEQTRVLTVALGVFKSQTPAGSPDWAGLMAATVVAAIPILILFLMFAKKVVNSIGFSGMK
jgi:multiple sugar transport system permease protein